MEKKRQTKSHGVSKPQKKSHQHCERSELRLYFKWTKVHQNAKNGQFWRVFENLNLKVKQCYQMGPL